MSTSTTTVSPNRFYEVTPSPSDAVSSLRFSPRADILVATSWDKQVRCWEVTRNGSYIASELKAQMSHDDPVLCSAWKDDGTTVFTGSCDKQAKMWPLSSSSEPYTVAMHDAPISQIAWIPEMELLVTGSWDKTLKYWDTRQATPAHTQQLPGKCYALTVNRYTMVVGTSDRNIVVFDLRQAQLEYKRIASMLKHQTMCIAAFPDQTGFVVGSIGGKIGVQHLNDEDKRKNFPFECHRIRDTICSVTSLNFHPIHGTFSSTGSDGTFNFWDKNARKRIKNISGSNQSIPCSTFNHDGSIFAYAACYDWSKGAEHHNPATAKTSIILYMPEESDVKAKPVETVSRKADRADTAETGNKRAKN